jgi:hypothetical protein
VLQTRPRFNIARKFAAAPLLAAYGEEDEIGKEEVAETDKAAVMDIEHVKGGWAGRLIWRVIGWVVWPPASASFLSSLFLPRHPRSCNPCLTARPQLTCLVPFCFPLYSPPYPPPPPSRGLWPLEHYIPIRPLAKRHVQHQR